MTRELSLTPDSARAAWTDGAARLRAMLDGLPAMVTVVTPDGYVKDANRQVLDYFGSTLEALRLATPGASFHPDDQLDVHANWERCRQTGLRSEYEARQRRRDGVYRWIHTQGFPLRDDRGEIDSWCFLQPDIDDARRAEALLAGEKKLLEMVASGDSLPDVLDALCRFTEENEPGAQCGVLLFAPGGDTWQHAAGPRLPAGYNATMHGRPAHSASGPCGLAAALKAEVVVADVTLDPRWATHGWRDLALSHGLRACWSSPILAQDKTALGALAIYRDEPGTPGRAERDLMRQATHIASIAVERAQNEARLTRSEAFLAKTRRLSSTGGVSKRMSTGEITWSDEVYAMFGFEPGVPVTLDLIMTRVHPEDAYTFDEMFRRQRQGLDYKHQYRLLMPDGAVRHLHVVAHAGQDHEDQLEYIAAVQDVTEGRLSEEALAKARSDLAHVASVSSLGVLTASIAHEVNQPLSGIITNASTCLRMLAADPPNVSGAILTARRTIRDGHRASDVIIRLRALFTGKGAVTEAIDLNDATREVIALALSDLQRNRIVLRTELSADCRRSRAIGSSCSR